MPDLLWGIFSIVAAGILGFGVNEALTRWSGRKSDLWSLIGWAVGLIAGFVMNFDRIISAS